jgi:hypothetical protein
MRVDEYSGRRMCGSTNVRVDECAGWQMCGSTNVRVDEYLPYILGQLIVSLRVYGPMSLWVNKFMGQQLYRSTNLCVDEFTGRQVYRSTSLWVRQMCGLTNLWVDKYSPYTLGQQIFGRQVYESMNERVDKFTGRQVYGSTNELSASLRSISTKTLQAKVSSNPFPKKNSSQTFSIKVAFSKPRWSWNPSHQPAAATGVGAGATCTYPDPELTFPADRVGRPETSLLKFSRFFPSETGDPRSRVARFFSVHDWKIGLFPNEPKMYQMVIIYSKCP